MNHLKRLTLSESFSSKLNKYIVFLFHKLRNEVRDLSSHWGKKEKSRHIYIKVGGISYVRRRKKVMHDLFVIFRKNRPSILLLRLNGTHGVKLVKVYGTPFFCVQFVFWKHNPKWSKIISGLFVKTDSICHKVAAQHSRKIDQRGFEGCNYIFIMGNLVISKFFLKDEQGKNRLFQAV